MALSAVEASPPVLDVRADSSSRQSGCVALWPH